MNIYTQPTPTTQSKTVNRTGQDRPFISGQQQIQTSALQWLVNNSHQTRQAVQMQSMADDYATRQPSIREEPIPHKARYVAQQINGHMQPAGQSQPGAIHHDPALGRNTDATGGKTPDHFKGHFTLPSLSMERSSPPSIVQRRIYVGPEGQEVKKEPLPAGDPDYDEKLDEMITDDVHRHFLDDDELQRFRNRGFGDASIDHIGSLTSDHLKPVQPWIRLPDRLIVVGENHTETTMEDLVRAFQTKRYMYEPYTTYDTAEFREYANNEHLPDGQDDHYHLEHAFIQDAFSFVDLHRYLSGPESAYTAAVNYVQITTGKGNPKWKNKTGGEHDKIIEYATMAFRSVLRIAKDVWTNARARGHQDLTSPQRELYNAWNKHAQQWNTMIGNYPKIEEGVAIGTLLLMAHEFNKTMTDLAQEMLGLTRLVMGYLAEYYKTSVDQTPYRPLKFWALRHARRARRRMNLQSPNYNKFDGNLMSWREQYMWKRIQHAHKHPDQYRLIGMGDDHRKNLSRKLDGLGIKHMFMGELVKNAKTEAEEREKRA